MLYVGPLHCEQSLLSFDASRISRQTTVRSHNAMAGNDERYGIMPYSTADGLRGHRRTPLPLCHLLRNLTVRHGASIWNGQQDVPYHRAERGIPHAHRRREIRRLSVEIRIQPTDASVENRQRTLLIILRKRASEMLLSIKPKACELRPVAGQRDTSQRRRIAVYVHQYLRTFPGWTSLQRAVRSPRIPLQTGASYSFQCSSSSAG